MDEKSIARIDAFPLGCYCMKDQNTKYKMMCQEFLGCEGLKLTFKKLAVCP